MNCDDGDPCTSDSCDIGTGCENQPNTGLSCDDGDACTENDTCNSSGVCQSGPTLDCDDGNECTVDSCNDLVGCISQNAASTRVTMGMPAPNSTSARMEIARASSRSSATTETRAQRTTPATR